MKGGTADVVVEKCHFLNAGERPLNAGGSTDADFFRPRNAKHEAARLIMRNNTIEGSLCAAAFVESMVVSSPRTRFCFRRSGSLEFFRRTHRRDLHRAAT